MAGVRVPELLPGRAYGLSRLEVRAKRLVAASSLGELKLPGIGTASISTAEDRTEAFLAFIDPPAT